jgi:hypothetical protein
VVQLLWLPRAAPSKGGQSGRQNEYLKCTQHMLNYQHKQKLIQ